MHGEGYAGVAALLRLIAVLAVGSSGVCAGEPASGGTIVPGVEYAKMPVAVSVVALIVGMVIGPLLVVVVRRRRVKRLLSIVLGGLQERMMIVCQKCYHA